MLAAEPGKVTQFEQFKVPVRRILGRNPGPMTGPGTNSYLIGSETLCLLDPGPRDDAQFDSFMAAIGPAQLAYILVTHTHGDHSPGALRVHEATGAELVGLTAPAAAGQDHTFVPGRIWTHDAVLDCTEYTIKLLHTPGHVSNHICFLLQEEQLLFTGDHILQGTTSVILPPDGDMAAYLDSLRFLQTLPLRALAPGHGDIMQQPREEISRLIAHRLQREQKLMLRLGALGAVTLEALVLSVYDDVAPHLLPWAKKTLLAHLLKLQREALVVCEGQHWRLQIQAG